MFIQDRAQYQVVFSISLPLTETGSLTECQRLHIQSDQLDDKTKSSQSFTLDTGIKYLSLESA